METSVSANRKLTLYSGNCHPQLAKEIANHLDTELGEPNLRRFADGQLHCRFEESIRGYDVFVIQTHAGAVNDSIMEQLIMIDAAKRASAKRITAVCPYYGYGRQDRKAEGREPITAKLVADLLTAAGANRVVSVDLHTGQIQGFFDMPVDHLTAMPVLLQYVRDACATDGIPTDELVVVAPDAGAVKAAKRFSGHLGADLAFVNKYRPQGTADQVVSSSVIGDVAGRRCVLLDDEIASGSTVCAAADLLKEHGATEVWAMATHGKLPDGAVERLDRSSLERVVVTDTVPLPPEKQIAKLSVVSVAGIIGDAIAAVFSDASVSDIFGGENQQ